MGSRILTGLGRLFSALFNLKIKLKYVLAVCIILVGTAVGLTASRIINNVGGDEDYLEAKSYIHIKDVITENYINGAERSRLGDAAAASMVNSLGDQWSFYMSEAEYKTYLLSSSAEYSDIGMSIMRDEAGRGFQVLSINPGSPAAQAGLAVGMIIDKVDGEDITDMDTDDVRLLIRSKLNTKFTLSVLNRDDIKVDCAASYISPVSSRLEKTEAGYIKINNFEAGSGKDAVAAAEELIRRQNAVALVIDLRGNPGGLMDELATFLDYFMPEQDMFVITDKNGNEKVYRSDNVCVDLPIVVLINAETYGAAEVAAAALHECGKAVLLGEATYGQTRTQEIIELEDGSAIRLSTRSYLTGNRVDISAAGGVIPDMIVHNTNAEATGTTAGTTGASDGTGVSSEDEQLMSALKYLS